MTVDPLAWTVALSLLLIAYVHVGYALALMVLRTVVRRPLTPASTDLPSVTLVIAALDERAAMAAKLANTRALDYPAALLQVVVVCDGSTDDTAAMARRHGGPDVVVLDDPVRLGKGAAINRAVQATTGAVVVVSDANAMYRPDALRRLVQPLADPEIGLVSGSKTVTRDPHVVGDGESAYWRYEAFVRRAESQTGSTVAVVGEILAIRRDLHTDIPTDVVLDDAYQCLAVLRAGYRVVYAETAVSVEAPSASRRDELERRRRIGAGRFQLLCRPALWPWRHPLTLWKLISHKFLRLVVPPLLLVAIAGSVVLAWRPDASRWVQFVLAAQLLFYGLALAGLRMSTWRLPRVATYIVAGHVGILASAVTYLWGGATPLWARVRRSDDGQTGRAS